MYGTGNPLTRAEAAVTADGTWNLTIESPMGAQDVSIDVRTDGEALTGTLVNNGNKLASEIFDGSALGNRLRWKVRLKQFKITLTFDAEIEGDAMTGQATAGMFGKFGVHGRRA